MYGESWEWTLRETEELREPLELRFRVDLARTELESWEVRGFEECWVPWEENDSQYKKVFFFSSFAPPPYLPPAVDSWDKSEKTYIITNWD